MLLLRLATTALCATSVILLVTFQPVRIVVRAEAPRVPPSMTCLGPRSSPLTVVDAAAVVTRAELDGLLHLLPGERVIAVNDHLVPDDLPADAMIEELRPGRFIDLTVSRGSTERRLLVLLH